MTEPTAEQPQVTATVSPAPPPKSRWDAIPHHLGRARTSTVVLGVLFLAIGALWLNVRPDPDPPTTVVPVVEDAVVPPPAIVPTPVPPTDPPASPEPTATSQDPATTPGREGAPEEPPGSPTATLEPSSPVPDPTGTPTG